MDCSNILFVSYFRNLKEIKLQGEWKKVDATTLKDDKAFRASLSFNKVFYGDRDYLSRGLLSIGHTLMNHNGWILYRNIIHTSSAVFPSIVVVSGLSGRLFSIYMNDCGLCLRSACLGMETSCCCFHFLCISCVRLGEWFRKITAVIRTFCGC